MESRLDIINALKQAAIIAGTDGHIKHLNKEAEKLLAIKRRQAAGSARLAFTGQTIAADKPVSQIVSLTIYVDVRIFNATCLPLTDRVDDSDDTILLLLDVVEEGTSRLAKEEARPKRAVEEEHSISYSFEDILGNSQAILNSINTAKRYAYFDAPVLIVGESGTGKEMFTQAIHGLSTRREGPFVAINCAAVPESLLESEIFGYSDGAFTGARKGGRAGLFEMADKGTLFLDEIQDMSLRLQSQLLRVLEKQQVRRLGDNKFTGVDVRVIAASNQDMEKLVAEQKFRLDLYHRLGVLRLDLPPLRTRREDIPMLAQSFARELSLKYYQRPCFLEDELIEKLCKMDWPGNIRQLRNVIERMIIVSGRPSVGTEILSLIGLPTQTQPEARVVLNGTADPPRYLEKETIIEALERSKWNKTKAARLLGIGRTTLWRKLKELEQEDIQPTLWNMPGGCMACKEAYGR